MDFSSFENQWEITGTIQLASALRIGAGQNAPEYSLSSSPVSQSFSAEEKTYLPVLHGSSLKGVIRSGLERLLRSFNCERSCVALSDEQGTARLCGEPDCITCSIFGSMQQGSKIRVDDAHLASEDRHSAKQQLIIREQPHPSSFTGAGGRKKLGPLRVEEVVAAGTRFDLKIRLDNASEPEAGLILLTLGEFNRKRLQVGGAVSRGLGFIDITNLKTERKRIVSGSLATETVAPDYLTDRAIAFLKTIDGKECLRNDFSVYAYSHDKPSSPPGLQRGHVVVKFILTTELPFVMAGMDEPTITNSGEPYIPGSTIKGFLRHRFAEQAECAPQHFIGGYHQPGNRRQPSRTEDFFGDMWNHRSRVLVSDAFITGKVTAANEIPKGTKLQMWMVFDNMQKEDIDEILSLVEKPVVITGKKSAGIDRKTGRCHPTHNQVRFTLNPDDISVFRTSTYLEGKIR